MDMDLPIGLTMIRLNEFGGCQQDAGTSSSSSHDNYYEHITTTGIRHTRSYRRVRVDVNIVEDS